MYGAILGDIIGSPFEFDRGDKTKNFDLFSEGCGFTDDSVMTIAVGEALLAVGPEAAVKEIEDAVASNMQDWGKRYLHAGYGGSFRHWLKENNPKPYGSYGNGSAMRVSAAGWLYDSIERTREVARATANVAHNHPEGIKGAEATASAIYMARNGSSKEEIKEYIEGEFNYNLDRTLDEIRPEYHMDETCQRTVPEAIIAFLESKDFEDAVRNAVSLGGDTDTLGAIATLGIRRAYNIQKAKYFPMPDYDFSSGVQVDVTVYGKTLDDNYMHILYDHPELNLQDAFLLDKVQKGIHIEKKDADRLRALKLVEGRLGSLYLSASAAKSIEDQAGYIKNKGLDDQYYKTLIIEYLKQYTKANRKEIDRLLWDKLPDSLSEVQKKNKIHNLLTSMKNKNLIEKDSDNQQKSNWVLK